MKKLILAVLTFFFFATAFAQMENPVKWTYSVKKIKGDVYELHMTAAIGAKWHLYAQEAGEGPIPTTISFIKNPIIKLDGKVIEIGKLEKEFDKTFKSTLMFYSKNVDCVQKLKLKSSVSTSIKGRIDYMTCNESRCIPNNVTFNIKVI